MERRYADSISETVGLPNQIRQMPRVMREADLVPGHGIMPTPRHVGRIVHIKLEPFAATVVNDKPKKLLFDHRDRRAYGSTANRLEFANTARGLAFCMPAGRRGRRSGLQRCALRRTCMCLGGYQHRGLGREVVDAQGMTCLDCFDQPKPRREIAIGRDSRLGFARLQRELALDADTSEEGRPSRTADYRKRR